MSKHLKEPEKKKLKINLNSIKIPDFSGFFEKSRHVTTQSIDKLQKLELDDDQLSFNNMAILDGTFIVFIILMLLHTHGWVRNLLFLIPFFAAGYSVIIFAFKSMTAGNFFNSYVMVFLSSVLALALGRFAEAAALMLFYRVTLIILAYVEKKTEEFVSRDVFDVPDMTRVETEDGILDAHSEVVDEGDIIVVGVNETVALDGIVTEGESTIDLRPLDKSAGTEDVGVGSHVLAGSVNLGGVIKVKTLRSYDECAAPKLNKLYKHARNFNSRAEIILSTADKYYSIVMAGIAILIGIVPPIFNGAWRSWVYRGAMLLAIGNIDLIRAAVTLAYDCMVSKLTDDGIVIKGHDCPDVISRTETLVTGKSGVITDGVYEISEVFPEGISADELITVAATAERNSKHPIAIALRKACKTDLNAISATVDVENIPGCGISAFVGSRHVYVGNAALLDRFGISYRIPTHPGTAVHVAVDNMYIGYILMSDRVRENTFDALESIRVLGIKNLVMLTSDMKSVVRSMASSLNFNMVKTDLDRKGKLDALDYLMSTRNANTKLTYVGRGDSDAELLKRADCGVVFDALKSGGAAGDADVVILGSAIKSLSRLFNSSRDVENNVVRTLAVYFGVKLVLTVLALTGAMNLWLIMFIDILAMVFSVISALGLIRRRSR